VFGLCASGELGEALAGVFDDRINPGVAAAAHGPIGSNAWRATISPPGAIQAALRC